MLLVMPVASLSLRPAGEIHLPPRKSYCGGTRGLPAALGTCPAVRGLVTMGHAQHFKWPPRCGGRQGRAVMGRLVSRPTGVACAGAVPTARGAGTHPDPSGSVPGSLCHLEKQTKAVAKDGQAAPTAARAGFGCIGKRSKAARSLLPSAIA